jgi:hypothetical protein
MTLIKIDRKSIRKNENAGSTTFLVPGRANPDGTRPVSTVRSLYPVPNYSASYERTEVECKFCHAKFPYDELKEDSPYNDDEIFENICPKCENPKCCEIEFEKFNNNTGKCECT